MTMFEGSHGKPSLPEAKTGLRKRTFESNLGQESFGMGLGVRNTGNQSELVGHTCQA